MPKDVFISGNWWKEVKKHARPGLVELSVSPFSVEVEFDKKSYALLEKHPTLHQQIMDAGSEEYKNMISEGVTLVRGCEIHLLKLGKQFEKDRDINAFMKRFQEAKISFVQAIHKLTTDAKKKIERAIIRAFNAYLKKKKDFQKYKIRVATKIGLKLGSIGFGVARLISTSGADVLAWRGLVKDAILTLTEAYKFMDGAEAFRKKINKQLDLIAAWHKKLGAGATASEVGLGILKSLIGTECEGTLVAVSANVKQYRKKLKGVELKAHAAAAELNVVLNRIESVKKEVDSKAQKELEDLTAKVMKLIDKITSAFDEINAGLAWADGIETQIDEMARAKNVKEMGTVIKLLDTASDVATSAKSWSSFAQEGKSLGAKVGSQANTAGKSVERWWDTVAKLRKKKAA